jgi:hypothetical protein
VHLPTCEVHRCHFEVPECANQRWPEAHQIAIHNNIRDFFASPLFTARTSTTVNNMCAASLDLERWRASEVVLLDIGKSLQRHLLEFCTTTTLLRRERLQPASTNHCNARNPPVAGLASNHPKHSRQEAVRSGSRCVAAHSRALLAPDSAHATAILAIHMSQSHTFRRLQP